jgi:hypothetical protein
MQIFAATSNDRDQWFYGPMQQSFHLRDTLQYFDYARAPCVGVPLPLEIRDRRRHLRGDTRPARASEEGQRIKLVPSRVRALRC